MRINVIGGVILKRIIFFDIDGTLYNNSGISENTINALLQLKANGHLIVICTGRSRAIIPIELLDIKFDAIIAGCGSYIECNGKVLENLTLEETLIMPLVESLKKSNIFPIFQGKDKVYIDEDNVFLKDKFYKSYEMFKDKFDTIKPNNKEINKIYCLIDKNSKVKEVIDTLREVCCCIYQEGVFLELVPLGITKESGIRKVLEYFGVLKINTYAFGDSLNDCEMLQYVEYGVAMGNAVQKVKDLANYVTDSIDNDGVCNGLKYYGLI